MLPCHPQTCTFLEIDGLEGKAIAAKRWWGWHCGRWRLKGAAQGNRWQVAQHGIWSLQRLASGVASGGGDRGDAFRPCYYLHCDWHTKPNQYLINQALHADNERTEIWVRKKKHFTINLFVSTFSRSLSRITISTWSVVITPVAYKVTLLLPPEA